jgi:hypothetical protein
MQCSDKKNPQYPLDDETLRSWFDSYYLTPAHKFLLKGW